VSVTPYARLATASATMGTVTFISSSGPVVAPDASVPQPDAVAWTPAFISPAVAWAGVATAIARALPSALARSSAVLRWSSAMSLPCSEVTYPG